MIVDISKILANRGQSAVDKIRQNLSSQNTSGATAASVRYVVTNNGLIQALQIWARKYFRATETGIKPYPQYTKASKKFVDAIRKWLSAKGGNPKHAYGVALAIHKRGTVLWRKGGRKDIFTNVIAETETTLKSELLQAVGRGYLASLKQTYDNSN